jgi:ribonucleoside-diphosphate reductase alpha chain
LEPKFITVKELKDNDMVGYPIPTYENDNVNYDEEFCRFYGIMIGDGHIYKKKNAYEYGLTFGKTKKINTLDFVKNYLTLKNINFWTCIDENKNTVSIRWSSKLINITYEMLYDNNKIKKIDNSFIHLPANKTLALIKGLIETDGCIYKEIAFKNTSYQVVITLRYLLLRIGVLSSGHIRNDIGKGHNITRANGKIDYIETKKICYEIRIPKDKKLKSIIDDTIITLSDKVGYFEYNNIIWSRIRKIKKINYSGSVYDFNMVDNHNYRITDF